MTALEVFDNWTVLALEELLTWSISRVTTLRLGVRVPKTCIHKIFRMTEEGISHSWKPKRGDQWMSHAHTDFLDGSSKKKFCSFQALGMVIINCWYVNWHQSWGSSPCKIECSELFRSLKFVYIYVCEDIEEDHEIYQYGYEGDAWKSNI